MGRRTGYTKTCNFHIHGVHGITNAGGVPPFMSDASVADIAILGGSFNPVHFGHLRLAMEMYEALAPQRLDFVPAARPPHKQGGPLLPFDLRCAMLEASLAGYPFFKVNSLEEHRSGPSYTYDTLLVYCEKYPNSRLWFILGSEDFEFLDSWKNWRELTKMTNLVVAARQGGDEASFKATVLRLWPEAQEDCARGQKNFRLPDDACIRYLPIPRLDISASLIRQRWLDGCRIDFWTPAPVMDVLRNHAVTVRKYWVDR